MNPPVLRIHEWIPSSRANGPGLRAVVWTQGCSLACRGCFNPATHPFGQGQAWPVDRLAQAVLAHQDEIEGVTVSGGEPFQQGKALAVFLAILRRESTLSTLVFTGYALDELAGIRYASQALANIDVLIAGRYVESQRVAHGLIGSANKTVHCLTSRYTPADLRAVPTTEALIGPDGELHLTGIDPPTWPQTQPAMTR